MNQKPRVVILGVGNLLYTDEGVGIHVIQRLKSRYLFPADVRVIDGGVMGIDLLSLIAEPEHLIVVDVIRNGRPPGRFYRLTGADLPRRVRRKQSLHQVDLLEVLTVCGAMGHVPKTIILGLEPQDMETLGVTPSPKLRARIGALTDRVLMELDILNVSYWKRSEEKCA
jgi:hydrogenase maturation protease